MKIIVFGATGGVGGELVRQALDAGHHVTAVVRDPATLAEELRAADVVALPVLDDPLQLAGPMHGQDVVLSALGPRGRSNAGVVSRLTRTITQAMGAGGVRRVLVTSAAPVGPAPEGEPFLLRTVISPAIRAIFRDVYADVEVMERELAGTDTAWTIVRAARLVNRAPTGDYRVAMETKPRGGASIGRSDFAHAMLAMITDEAVVRHAVGVAY